MEEAYRILQAARAKDRPTARQYISHIFTGFIELHGDRRFGDDAAIVGGVGRLCGRPVTVIAQERGETLSERMRRNFGMAHPEGYRKALRLMKQAEKFHRPVVTLVDTSGAFCGLGAEERGQGLAIAENLCEMMALRTPVLSVLIGEGGSGGALGIAVANEVWMLENSVYSVISPEGCASILWKDPSKVKDACACLKLTPQDLLRMGVADRVIPQEKTFEKQCESLQQEMDEALGRMLEYTGAELAQRRYDRFRKMGVYSE
ncbi:MAG: acetyl-CoA carboxylase carboxyltransferase subunit alpha [Oscillospiraceae bacterium]|nr:acetyl-CoA carboxylase carboxyltransferase subunit alpha [Oscillospiraceae bacterium]